MIYAKVLAVAEYLILNFLTVAKTRRIIIFASEGEWCQNSVKLFVDILYIIKSDQL